MYIFVNNTKFKLKICTNVIDRFMGLMLKKNINIVYLFPHCSSIHTFFMKENIDVIFTDNNNNILKIYTDVKKNKILFCKKSYNVYELPSKKIYLDKNSKIKVVK